MNTRSGVTMGPMNELLHQLLGERSGFFGPSGLSEVDICVMKSLEYRTLP
jgi:hypothetical protein